MISLNKHPIMNEHFLSALPTTTFKSVSATTEFDSVRWLLNKRIWFAEDAIWSLLDHVFVCLIRLFLFYYYLCEHLWRHSMGVFWDYHSKLTCGDDVRYFASSADKRTWWRHSARIVPIKFWKEYLNVHTPRTGRFLLLLNADVLGIHHIHRIPLELTFLAILS